MTEKIEKYGEKAYRSEGDGVAGHREGAGSEPNAEAGFNSGGDGKTLETPENGNKTKNGGLKVVLVIAIMTVVLVGGLVAFLLISGNKEGGSTVKDDTVTTPKEDEATHDKEIETSDIYGYTVVCDERDSYDRKCNFIELHKNNDDVMIARYDYGNVSIEPVVGDQVCWSYPIGEYVEGEFGKNFQINENILECAKIGDVANSRVEVLRLPTPEIVGYWDYIVTRDAVFYRFVSVFDTEEKIDAERYRRYDFSAGDSKCLDGDFADAEGVMLAYSNEYDLLYWVGASDGWSDDLRCGVLDNELNQIEELTWGELKKKYPGLEPTAARSNAQEYYLRGHKITVDSALNQLMIDDEVVYGLGEEKADAIQLAYSGVASPYNDYSDGEKLLFGVARGCSGQTCMEFKTLVYDVKTGEITELSQEENWVWAGAGRGFWYYRVN